MPILGYLSILAIILNLLTAVLAVRDQNVLFVVASLVACAAFVFLLQYARNSTQRSLNLFSWLLLISVSLNLIRMLIGWGYL